MPARDELGANARRRRLGQDQEGESGVESPRDREELDHLASHVGLGQLPHVDHDRSPARGRGGRAPARRRPGSRSRRSRSAQHGITATLASALGPKRWSRTRSVRTTIPSARAIAAPWTRSVIRWASPPRGQRPASTYSSASSPRMSKISRQPVRRRTISPVAAGTWLRAWIASSRWRRTSRAATRAPTSAS